MMLVMICTRSEAMVKVENDSNKSRAPSSALKTITPLNFSVLNKPLPQTYENC
jgi:hypothetical protein